MNYRFKENRSAKGAKLLIIVGTKPSERSGSVGLDYATGQYQANGRTIANNPQANACLAQIIANLENYINQEKTLERPINPTALLNIAKGQDPKMIPTFNDVLDGVLRSYERKVNGSNGLHTYQTRQMICDRIKEFIKVEFGKNVIELADFKPITVTHFWEFLTITKGLNPETARRYKETVKSVFKIAYQNEWHSSDPLANFKTQRAKKGVIEYLTAQQLDNIRALDLKSNDLDRAKGLFLFMSQTGLSYMDLSIVSYEQIQTDQATEVKLLKGKRGKNGTDYTIPLNPEALNLIKIWGLKPQKGSIFKLETNQQLNRLIKEVGLLAGINNVKVVCHLARKTFATLNAENGFTPQALTKMMGHAKYNVTEQYYVGATDKMVINQHLNNSVSTIK